MANTTNELLKTLDKLFKEREQQLLDEITANFNVRYIISTEASLDIIVNYNLTQVKEVQRLINNIAKLNLYLRDLRKMNDKLYITLEFKFYETYNQNILTLEVKQL